MKHISEVIDNIEQNKKNIEFLPTGFKKLDAFLDGGFMRKELIVIGGHTGIGKSYVAGQIFYQLAIEGFNSAYFSLEVSNEMIASRLIGSLSNIKPTRIYAGLLTPEEFDDKARAKARLTTFDSFLTLYDDVYLFADLKKHIREGKYDFVVIDFIQNVFIPGVDEYTRLSQVALELQQLAKETSCCILVLSQLSNRVAKDGSKVVEYKGSGSIAMVCDLGFFIERNDMDGITNEVRLNLKKNRRGISGFSFPLRFTHPGGWMNEV